MKISDRQSVETLMHRLGCSSLESDPAPASSLTKAEAHRAHHLMSGIWVSPGPLISHHAMFLIPDPHLQRLMIIISVARVGGDERGGAWLY